MLRQDSARIESQSNGTLPQHEPTTDGVSVGDAARTKSVDIQRELSRLEEMILESPRVPFTRRTLIDEEKLLDHLDKIRLNLPGAFQDASELLRRQEEILQQAEQYAREVVESAERQASGILDEMGIVRQAKVEADRVRQQVQLDCDAAQDQTIAEIEQLQRQAQQEFEAMRARAIAEAEAIETGADEYADRVLRNIEQQFSEMLRVIRNGRQQLQQESAYRVHDKTTTSD
jgi:cell division septum initiation protein DivIVA